MIHAVPHFGLAIIPVNMFRDSTRKRELLKSLLQVNFPGSMWALDNKDGICPISPIIFSDNRFSSEKKQNEWLSDAAASRAKRDRFQTLVVIPDNPAGVEETNQVVAKIAGSYGCIQLPHQDRDSLEVARTRELVRSSTPSTVKNGYVYGTNLPAYVNTKLRSWPYPTPGKQPRTITLNPFTVVAIARKHWS
jgi:hypothetical protein